MLAAFKENEQIDQQQLILKEIECINQQLHHSNTERVSSTNKLTNKYSQALLKQVDENYFSQQCDQLFQQSNNVANNKNKYNQSLFESENDLLINLYESGKEIVNFKKFETNHLELSVSNKFESFNKRKQQQKKAVFKLNKNSMLNQKDLINNKSLNINSKNQTMSSNNSSCRLNKQSMSSNTSSSRLKKGSIVKKQPVQPIKPNYYKQSCKNKFKKFNELNKQNILSNNNQQKSDSDQGKPQKNKPVSRKVRFQTMPQCLLNQTDQLEDSLDFNHLETQYSKLQSTNRPKPLKHHCGHDSKQNSLQCTFKPSILKKSYEIAELMQPSFSRLTQQISQKKSQQKLPYKPKQQNKKGYSAQRIERLSQPRKVHTISQAEAEKQLPSFRPSLSKKSLRQMANCTLDVASRNKLWLEQKQAKINKIKIQQQQAKQRKQIGNYTPKINNYKGQSQVHLSRFAKEGIAHHFERVSAAKHKKQVIEKPKSGLVLSSQNPQESKIMKKKTYNQAVKELHKKIMHLNI